MPPLGWPLKDGLTGQSEGTLQSRPTRCRGSVHVAPLGTGTESKPGHTSWSHRGSRLGRTCEISLLLFREQTQVSLFINITRKACRTPRARAVGCRTTGESSALISRTN